MNSLFPFGRVPGTRSNSGRRRPLPLSLEALEDRCVPTVFTVNSLADVLNPAAGVVTLRSAIQQANQTPGGNTINLAVAGDYRIALPGANTGTNDSGAFAILPAGGNLSIVNTSGGTVAVDGAGLDRVFDINPQGGTAAPKFLVAIQGVTIENGLAQPGDGATGSGGGIRDQGNASLTLINDILTNNAASADGGGVSMENTASTPWTLTLTNTTVTNNRAGDAGGGVETDGSGHLNITNSTITNNTSTNQGAGVWLDAILTNNVFQGATLNITGSLISGNQALAADNFGGGVGNAGNGVVTITNSTLSDNFSGGNGGGFADQNGVGTLIVLNSTIVNNSSIADGGGVFEGSANTTTIQNSTITGNASQANAGGVEVMNGNLVLNNTIVAGNFAGPMNFVGGVATVTVTNPGGNPAVFGGGVPYQTPPMVVFTNATGDTTGNGAAATATITNGMVTAVTITNAGTGYQLPPLVSFVSNSGSGAAAVATIVGAAPDIFANVSTGSGNFIGIGDLNLTGLTNGTNGNQLGTLAAPLNPLLGALQNNGGLTPTRAPLAGSPVINAGVNTVLPATDPITGNPLTDQRGFLRLVGTTVDVGAVEFQPGATTTTLSSSAAKLIQGGTVTLTAHVAPTAGAPNNPVTGTVAFTDGNLALGAATLDANGNASITISNLPLGASTVVATYTPDTNAATLGFTTSASTPLPETVNAANITPILSLTTSVTTVTTTTVGGTTFSQTVTITLKVTAPTGVTAVPTGNVTFFDGNLVLNTTPVALDATGTATFQLTGLPMGNSSLVGGQSLTAIYTPDAAGMANGFVAATSKAAVVTVGTPAELVLNQLFKDLLGRTVNPNDLGFWIPQLGDQSNPTSVTAQSAVQKVAAGILSSQAFHGQEISWLFENYLGRAPNQNDLNFWLPNFQNGMTIEQAAAIFITSPEFIQKNGGTSDGTVNGIPSQGLITALYQSVLGRAPVTQDFQAVQGKTYAQLVTNIFSTPEYEGHTVDVFYQDFLRRTVRGNEAAYWLNFFPGGPAASAVPTGVQPDVFIISGFIGSQEYISDALNNPLGLSPVPLNPLQASIT